MSEDIACECGGAECCLLWNDPRHGTHNGYTNRRCRCPRCREAWRLYHAHWMRANPNRRMKDRERKRVSRRLNPRGA